MYDELVQVVNIRLNYISSYYVECGHIMLNTVGKFSEKELKLSLISLKDDLCNVIIKRVSYEFSNVWILKFNNEI